MADHLEDGRSKLDEAHKTADTVKSLRKESAAKAVLLYASKLQAIEYWVKGFSYRGELPLLAADESAQGMRAILSKYDNLCGCRSSLWWAAVPALWLDQALVVMKKGPPGKLRSMITQPSAPQEPRGTF